MRGYWLVGFSLLLPSLAQAQAQEGARTKFKGSVATEPRVFPQAPSFAQQDSVIASLAAELELRHEWDGRSKALVVDAFGRVDQGDPQRTHFDVREAALRWGGDGAQLVAGVSRVFWGVTESQHLVDIVNQTDLVENPDGEEKLGQLMVHLTLERSWGTLGLFVLPGARERTFPGLDGRLRTPLPVDPDAAVFEAGRWHVDFAARYSRTIGPVDLGVSHFQGTTREPRLVRVDDRLVPHYELIGQTGLDAQVTVGQWLWKAEAIHRTGQGRAFVAVTAGFEYTFANVGGSGADIGLLAEYLYDDRGRLAPTPWQDDVFAGVRLARGDAQSTELLVGVIVDRKGGGRAWSVEGSRRIGAHVKFGLEARSFSGAGPDDVLYALQRDDYVQLSFAYHF
jgi:hypothetical protein